MNVLLDTNIILSAVRARNEPGILRFINPENSKIYISIVSEAEIRSFAIRKKWGANRLDFLNDFLTGVNIVEVNQLSVATYTEIDTYSQRLNPNFETYPFNTPRNMGKNDLWIASLAALLGLRLVTTDADFDHLHNVFFEVKKIKPEEFVAFF
ncbi:MAG TPA: type II toxin-antitoxin system VapC family toxin [Mucilaginibacter sp.]